MANDVKFANFKPDSAGIMAVFKSAGMRSALRSCAESLAGRANAVAIGNRSSMSAGVKHGIKAHDPSAFNQPPYKAGVKVGRSTALGTVKPATLEGASDTKRNHTLQHLS